MADDLPYDSHYEARTAELAIAANEYKDFALEVFERHGQQIVPVLVMLAANATSCACDKDGHSVAKSDELPDAVVKQAFVIAKGIAEAGPAVLSAFLYALGAELSDQIRMSTLARQVAEALPAERTDLIGNMEGNDEHQD